ncbi:hypothetical protein T492DRAFT_831737 [Pavlovales sp. CCMP2436]|nr:hypothetical protein T492DRAFT_831737 [Pavlovales sp. CCMP2436]
MLADTYGVVGPEAVRVVVRPQSSAGLIAALDAAAQTHMALATASADFGAESSGEDAVECLSRSLALRVQLYGRESPAAAAARETLAKFLNVRALLAMAPDVPKFDLARACLAEAMRVTGEGERTAALSSVRASTLSNMAIYYMRTGRAAQAKTQLQKALYMESAGAPLPAPAPLPSAQRAVQQRKLVRANAPVDSGRVSNEKGSLSLAVRPGFQR